MSMSLTKSALKILHKRKTEVAVKMLSCSVVGAQAWLPHNKDGAQTDREYRDLTLTHELTNT